MPQENRRHMEVFMPLNIQSSIPIVTMASTAPFLFSREVCPLGVGPFTLTNYCPEYQTVESILSYNMPIIFQLCHHNFLFIKLFMPFSTECWPQVKLRRR